MELRDCNFNEKGEIVCEEVELSLKPDTNNTNPAITTEELDMSTSPKKHSDLPQLDKKVV